MKMCIKKIKHRITIKIKTGHYLKPLTSETMKLLRSTKSKVIKNGNGRNVPYLEINEAVLISCSVGNNSYQQNSRVLHALAPNKSFGQSLSISHKNVISLKTFDSEYSAIEVLNGLQIKILNL